MVLLLVAMAVMVGLVLRRRRQLDQDMREAVRALESARTDARP